MQAAASESSSKDVSEHDKKHIAEERERNRLVHQAIAEVLPSDDPFDEQNFDATKIINGYFPSEQSLNSAEAVADSLAAQMTKANHLILQAVEHQSSAGEEAKQDLENADASVSRLTEGLARIGAKSRRTEATIRSICGDIQALDWAKQNLTQTVTVLRRLNMLETALEQLEDMTKVRAYKDAANLLEAVIQLAANFESFKRLPRIAELLSSVRAVRSQLQAQVMEEFKLHVAPTIQEDVVTMLGDASLVITVMGKPVVNKLLHWFSAKELGEYETLFDPSKSTSTLDGVDRRFSWLRKWLREYTSSYSTVLAPSWNAPRCLCEEYCAMTRKHFSVMLHRASKDLDVRLLLHVMQRTIQLEEELTRRFTAGAGGVDEGDTTGGQRLHGARGGDFTRMISGVFKPYMPLYLKLETAHMVDLVKKLVSEETWGPGPQADEDADEDDLQILHSSGELFIYIKRSLLQCKDVDTGETMLHLSHSFASILVKYAEQLHKHVATLMHKNKPLTSKEELACAYVVNTCEYCCDTISQLEASVHKHLDASLTSQVNYSSACDAFEEAMSAGLEALASSCLIRLDAPIASMLRLRWGEVENVGDTSAYVGQCQVALQESAPQIRNMLSSIFFSAYCDKAVTGFFARYQSAILKLKKVSDAGVQQLLLDTNALKTLFNSLPIIGIPKPKPGGEPEKKPSGSYLKLVAAESSKLEVLLKVLMSNAEEVEENYRAMVKGGTVQQLQRILEIKGVRNSAPQVLDALEETRAAGQAQLQTFKERLEQASLKSNFDVVAGKVVGQVAKAAWL